MPTGGCQCGAVRFRVTGGLGPATICHCRMCQKAFGSAFGPLVPVRTENLVWLGQEPARFQSSDQVWRGFCQRCGTPLTYERTFDEIELAVGAFDDPRAIPITAQLATVTALSWVFDIGSIPERPSGAPEPAVNYQHPDHEV